MDKVVPQILFVYSRNYRFRLCSCIVTLSLSGKLSPEEFLSLTDDAEHFEDLVSLASIASVGIAYLKRVARLAEKKSAIWAVNVLEKYIPLDKTDGPVSSRSRRKGKSSK